MQNLANIITFLQNYGGRITVVLFLLFLYFIFNVIRNAARLAQSKDIKAQQNPLDGRRFDESPERLQKRIRWQLRLSGFFFLMFIICLNTVKVINGGSSHSRNSINDNGATPLMEAVRHDKSISHLASLIDKGENVNAKDKLGYTPLMYAAAWAGPDEMQFLIDRGANINDRDNSGDTAIFKAIKWRKPENVFFLAKKGVDLNSTGYANYTPLVAALNDWNIIQQGKAQTDVSKLRSKNRHNYERDMQRKEDALRAIVQFLIAKNVNPTIRDSRGRDAIEHSLGTEFEALVKVLALKHTIKDSFENAKEGDIVLVMENEDSSKNPASN